MTAAELVGPHTGSHCPPPSPITLFFRRALRMARREPVAPEMPEGVRSGAAGSTWGDAPAPEAASLVSGARPSAVLYDTGTLAVLREPGHPYPRHQPRRLERPDGWIEVDEHRAVHVRLRRPVYGERPVADVLAAEQEITYHRADHDEIDRQFTDRPELALLRRVRAGLLKAS